MPNKYASQAEAIRAVQSWKLGIEFLSMVEMVLIPQRAVIGLRRLGTLDYLIKFGWKLKRERG
jgi:hypothetical protein